MANAPVAGLLLGIRKPLVVPPNWLLWKFSSLSTTGSIGVVVLPKNACEIEASERSVGSDGIVVLMNVPGERPLTLPRALIVHEEISELFLDHRAAEAAAKNVLLDRGPRQALADSRKKSFAFSTSLRKNSYASP